MIQSTKDSKMRKSLTSNKERETNETNSNTREGVLSLPKKTEMSEEEADKPWISYLRNLRIPMMCQLHRKITYAISENALKATPPQQSKAKRDKSPSAIKKRQMNRNPNCNHNSKLKFLLKSIGNLTSAVHNKGEAVTNQGSFQNKDLLWKNGKNYSETSELNSLKGLLIRLFFDNSLGEDPKKSKSKNSAAYVLRNDINRMYSEFEEFYSNDDILIDGNIVNKYSLWIIKNLNPHHKAYVYALMKCGKVNTRELALMAINN